MPPITTNRRRKPRANWLTNAHLKNAGGGVVLTIKQVTAGTIAKVLRPTQYKIMYFGDVPQTNLLAWCGKN